MSRAIVQVWLETWQQLAIDFQQTEDPGLREAVAVHVGAAMCDLERHHERAATPRDRTISQDVRYRSGLVIQQIVDDLIATTDGDELRYVVHFITCMTAVAADDDFDDHNDDSVDDMPARPRAVERQPRVGRGDPGFQHSMAD